MARARQGADVRGNGILINFWIVGLIIALVPGLSSALAESESKSNKRLVSRSATNSGHLKVVQAEKEVLPSGEASDQPIEITSKKVIAKKTANGQEIVFEANVQAKQDNFILTCDRLIVIYDQKKKNGQESQDWPKKNSKDLKESGVFKSATALGNVKVVHNETKAVAGKAVFDSVKKTITLTENPKIWRGLDWGTASIITIYLNENRVETEGDNKFVINPQKM